MKGLRKPPETEFGPLLEGLRAAGAGISAEERRAITARFIQRHQLSQWSRYPEGHRVTLTLSNGRNHTLRILTPPNMIAQRAEGPDGEVTWLRRLRNHAIDPPVPYDWEWYTQYLLDNHLPRYFFQMAHLDMLHADHPERATLGINVDLIRDSLITENPRSEWYPDPLTNDAKPYRFRIDKSQAKRIRANYPSAALQSQFDNHEHYRDHGTVVLPSGHIVIRRLDDMPNSLFNEDITPRWFSRSEVRDRISDEVRRSNLASFASNNGEPSSREDSERTRRMRQTLIEWNQMNGAIINPGDMLNGSGRWTFLEESDEQYAAALGFETPQQVTEARSRGLLPLGVGPERRPVVSFLPYLVFLNPTEQPRVRGTWRYLSTVVEQLAHINYGGNPDIGLEDERRPSASTIWTLRQILARNPDNPPFAAEIDIIWDIEETDNEPERTIRHQSGTTQVREEPPAPRRRPRPTTQTSQPARPVQSTLPQTGLRLSTLLPRENASSMTVERRENRLLLIVPRGPHNWQANDWQPTTAPMDQRGIASNSRYEEIKTKSGFWIIADRGAARRGQPEPHKFFAWDNKASKWKGCPHRTNEKWSWDNEADISKLNKWRDQSYGRWGWPSKRQNGRDDYTQEENKWLWDHLASDDAGNAYQTIGTADLCAAFRERFGYERSEAAINSKVSRLRLRFQQNPVWQATRGRGNHKKKNKEKVTKDRVNDSEGEDEDREEGDQE